MKGVADIGRKRACDEYY